MIYGSICSGIEAATVAWEPLSWRPSFFSEIEKFPRAVLAEHYPETPLHGDFTTIRAGEYDPIDVLVGGTPCQSFSVAGLRGGLGDSRGNLALEYLKLAQRLGPKWLVWENVPGVLSSAGGRDFGSILGGLVELGYGFAYRVLDAQFFGVPQRRRRVFVVGYLGDWRRAAAVLFERDCLSGHPAPRREAGQRAAPTISARTEGGGGLGTDFDLDGGLIARCVTTREGAAYDAETTTLIAHSLRAQSQSAHDTTLETYVAHALRADGFDASEDGTGRGTPLVPVAFSSKDHGADAGDLSPTLRAMGHSGSHANAGGQVAIAYNITPSQSNKDYNARASERSQAITSAGNRPSARGGDVIAFNTRQDPIHGPQADPLGTKDNGHGILRGSAVRRLTPRECERLQGFPDDYTLITHRKKPAADGPRYKALGNSMAVPVMRWIGERIQTVETITARAAA